MGLVVGVVDKGETEYLGMGRDRGEGTAPTPDTLFEIGSLTKTFTSLLFSIAIERGLVTPATTLGELRAEWRNQQLGSITLLELATHRSGLPRLPCDLHYADPANPYADYTEAELVASITDEVIAAHADCRPAAHPSREIAYSNWGAALLGFAIGTRAGLSYEAVLREWITGPLGMRDTVVALSEEQLRRMAQVHTRALLPTGRWTRQSMFGNGAIISSARDLATYAKALLGPARTPIAAAILRAQERQYQDIAYGWFLTPTGSIWHNGMTGGFASLFKAYVHKDLAVFALSNTALDIQCLIEAVEELQCTP